MFSDLGFNDYKRLNFRPPVGSIRPKNWTFHYPHLADQVIQGYELGVPGMCTGETRTLTVPPNLAYGDRGTGM